MTRLLAVKHTERSSILRLHREIKVTLIKSWKVVNKTRLKIEAWRSCVAVSAADDHVCSIYRRYEYVLPTLVSQACCGEFSRLLVRLVALQRFMR